MIVGSFRLTPISAFEARRLPEGTVLIVQRIWRDHKSYAVTRMEYYRAVLRRKKTVAGMDEALYSAPDCDWSGIPTWQLGWIWLEDMSGVLGFFTMEREVQGSE